MLEVASTSGGHSGDQMAILQGSIAGSFWNETSGGVSGAVDRMLTYAVTSGRTRSTGCAEGDGNAADTSTGGMDLLSSVGRPLTAEEVGALCGYCVAVVSRA